MELQDITDSIQPEEGLPFFTEEETMQVFEMCLKIMSEFARQHIGFLSIQNTILFSMKTSMN